MPDSPEVTKVILSVIGVTCSGKSTFIDYCVKEFGDIVFPVQIGKILRAKYPPEYFEGLGAMAKTSAEVSQLLRRAITEFAQSDKVVMLLDGVPREASQVPLLQQLATDSGILGIYCLHLQCSDDILRQRAEASRSGASLDLALARITNDKIMYEKVVPKIAEASIPYLQQSTEDATKLDYIKWLRGALGLWTHFGG